MHGVACARDPQQRHLRAGRDHDRLAEGGQRHAGGADVAIHGQARARGQALGSFTHWFWAALVSWTFPIIAEASGASAFAFFAAMMVLQFVLVWVFLPETKGVSLERIQRTLGIE